jgi:ribose 5-phosphate isomerase B
MKRVVVSEQTVRDALNRGSQRIDVPQDAIVTALAAELALSKGVSIMRVNPGEAAPRVAAPVAAPGERGPVVAIGSDHGGFGLKGVLIEYLGTLGARVVDAGTYSEEPCDYPDYAREVALAVARGNADLGIMIDGAGIGSCMAVNKIPGIRGACCAHEFTARNAREHNNANVLTLGSRVIGLELAKGIVRMFLVTPFAGGRHESRVNKIMDLEKGQHRT